MSASGLDWNFITILHHLANLLAGVVFRLKDLFTIVFFSIFHFDLILLFVNIFTQAFVCKKPLTLSYAA